VTCVVCLHRPVESGSVCPPCTTTIDTTLTDIAELTAQLPAALVPGQTRAEHVSGTPEPPLPLQLAPLDLLMPPRVLRLSEAGSAARDDQTGDLSVASTLDTWVRDWQSYLYRERLPRPTVPRLVCWLRDRLGWAVLNHPAMDDFAGEMRELRARLRTVVGQRSERCYVGLCPVDINGSPCGATLSADPFLDIIECRRCLTRWDRQQWLWLGMVLRSA
jgi:hypothetical protein